MGAFERFIEMQEKFIDQMTIGIWIGQLLLFFLLVLAILAFREAYMAYKIQKKNEQKLKEINKHK